MSKAFQNIDCNRIIDGKICFRCAGNQTISTATYNESDDIELKVPAVRDNSGALKTSEAVTFKFMASLSKESALFNVNDSNGLIPPVSDGTYELTVPKDITEEGCKDYYLMFNVADAETETTYTITVSVVLEENTPETTGQTMTVELLSGANKLATKAFSTNPLNNTLTYGSATEGNTLSYSLTGLPSVSGITYSVKADASSYADEAGKLQANTDNASGKALTGNTGVNTLVVVPLFVDIRFIVNSFVLE